MAPATLGDLPDELLICVVELLQDNRSALRDLSLASRRLQALAEPVLYRTFFFVVSSELSRFYESARQHPWRSKAVQVLDARCKAGFADQFLLLADLLELAPNIRELTIESPFCNNRLWADAEKSAGWDKCFERWMEPLIKATTCNPTAFPSELHPLQVLTKLTLHLSGVGREFYTVEKDLAELFAHPTLLELHISSINLPKHATDNLPPGLKTPLKRLTLDETNVTFEGLRGVLALPEALEYLYIGENSWSQEEEAYPPGQTYNKLHERDRGRFLEILSLQQRSLETLTYSPKQPGDWGVLHSPSDFPLDAGSFRAFEKLRAVSLIGECGMMSHFFLHKATAPPNLTFLAVGHNAFMELFTRQDVTLGQPPRFVSMLTSAIEPLQQLDVVCDLFDFGEPGRGFQSERERGIIVSAGNFLKQKGVRLRVLRPLSRLRFVRPILYGETEPMDILIYVNDDQAFRRGAREAAESLLPSGGSESGDDADGEWMGLANDDADGEWRDLDDEDDDEDMDIDDLMDEEADVD